MPLLLLSLGVGAVPDFVDRHTDRGDGPVRVGYLDDAARPYGDAPFITAERERVAALGFPVTTLTAGAFDDADSFAAALDDVDVLYVAGGDTFALLAALRRHGADAIVVARVRAGLPYIGSSAGSIIAGPSVEPAEPMDDPGEAPDLVGREGLALVDTVVIPHADGALPPYPPALIAGIRETYGGRYPLTFLNDDQALLIDDGPPRVIASAGAPGIRGPS